MGLLNYKKKKIHVFITGIISMGYLFSSNLFLNTDLFLFSTGILFAQKSGGAAAAVPAAAASGSPAGPGTSFGFSVPPVQTLSPSSSSSSKGPSSAEPLLGGSP